MTNSNTSQRYCCYRSLHARYLYVQPEDDAQRPGTEKMKLGFVSTFSKQGVKAFANQVAKQLELNVIYVNFPAEV